MPRENQKEEATPAIPGGDAFFAGIPRQMELKGFGKSKMKHHNFEQTSVAKNVCIWIQHAQSLFYFFFKLKLRQIPPWKHGSHSNFSDLILGVVPGPAPAGPAGVCLGFLKVGMSLGARKYVFFFFVRLVVVVVLMVQKFDVLKAVKLGSLSTLSHYFQDEMGGTPSRWLFWDFFHR